MLLVLLACFQPDARPYGAFELDYDALPTPDPDAPTPRAFEACSDLQGDPFPIDFINRTDDRGELVRITEDCRLQTIETLDVDGILLDVRVFEGEVFRLGRRDASGELLWVDEQHVEADTTVLAFTEAE